MGITAAFAHILVRTMQCEIMGETHVKTCQFLLGLMIQGFWVSAGLITALNIALPSSTQFLSSLVLRGAPETDITNQILATLGSSVFQLYLLVCLAQTCILVVGTLMFFTFPMADVAVSKA